MAIEPCNIIQSSACFWQAPNGKNGSFTIITDGCNAMIKLSSSLGKNSELFLNYSSVNINTGDSKINDLFQAVLNNFKKLQARKNKTDKDIEIFLNRTMTRIILEKHFQNIENSKEKLKVNVSQNAISKTDKSKFNDRIKKESKHK